jgi:putative copper export protein
VVPISLGTVRLFLHVLAATVWVGGQLTLAGLVPALRRLSPDAPRVLARQFSAIAWSAYGALIATGIWNAAAVHATLRGRYGTTLLVKIAIVALSGVSAAVHGASRSPRGQALWGH